MIFFRNNTFAYSLPHPYQDQKTFKQRSNCCDGIWKMQIPVIKNHLIL
jgi:hypothetical protein